MSTADSIFLQVTRIMYRNIRKYIDVGAGGALGVRAPQDFAINKEVPFLFSENFPCFLRKNCPRSVVPPKFEMLPTSLREYFPLETQLTLYTFLTF